MSKVRYELATSTWDDAEFRAIDATLASEHYTMGHTVEKFERDFADTVGSAHAVMVNSGSSANLLAVSALLYRSRYPLRAGDEVIVPSLSWSTTFFPIHQCGLTLVFVDIDRRTLNIDTNCLKAALSPKTRAVVIPHILGNPANIRAIRAFCMDNGLEFIEDACESLGATIDGRCAGTFGICGTFSTFFSHHISTIEGGVIVTNDEEVYHILLALRSHGWTRNLPHHNRLCVKSDRSFYEFYRFILPGYNLRPTEIGAAIGIEQLKKLDAFLRVRRANADYFRSRFDSDRRFVLQQEHGVASWFGFAMLLDNGLRLARDGVTDVLRHAGIEVRPIVAGNFLRTEVVSLLRHRIVGSHDNADYVHVNGFMVGNHHYDVREKIDYLHQVLDRIC